MLTVTLCTSGIWTVRSFHASHPERLPAALHRQVELRHPPPIDRIAPETSSLRQHEQRLDLYGNDVSNAVATYTYDRAGTVYEEHSPQTEVPRLKPPVS